MSENNDMGASADADRAGVPSGLSPSGSQAKPLIPSAIIEAIEFYAFAENWHGVYMVGHGPMADDWSDDFDNPQYPDGKPGRLARDAVRWLYERGYYDELKEQVASAVGSADAPNSQEGD